jgi:hypothetical protein
MNGKAPVAILTTFENTKFPSVADKIKNLVTSREEALAAHELAQSCIVKWIKSNFVPFKKGQMVWLDSRHTITRRWLKNEKDCSKLKSYWDQLLTVGPMGHVFHPFNS